LQAAYRKVWLRTGRLMGCKSLWSVSQRHPHADRGTCEDRHDHAFGRGIACPLAKAIDAVIGAFPAPLHQTFQHVAATMPRSSWQWAGGMRTPGEPNLPHVCNQFAELPWGAETDGIYRRGDKAYPLTIASHISRIKSCSIARGIALGRNRHFSV